MYTRNGTQRYDYVLLIERERERGKCAMKNELCTIPTVFSLIFFLFVRLAVMSPFNQLKWKQWTERTKQIG